MSTIIELSRHKKLKIGLLLGIALFGAKEAKSLEIMMGCKINGADAYVIFDDKYEAIWVRYGVYNQAQEFIGARRSGGSYTDYVVVFRSPTDGSSYEADFRSRLLKSTSRGSVLQCR
jgi:hypothetical protein